MHHCPHCQRSYQRKVYYDRHIALCEILCKSKKERAVEVEEYSDTPTVRDLYKVVLEMAVKYNDLEKKYKEMEKFVNVKKQKLDIVVWLTTATTHSMTTDYTLWFNNITVTREHLELLFKTDYVTCVVKVLKDHLPSDDEFLPLRAFDEKANIFYVFLEQNTKKQWSMMMLQ